VIKEASALADAGHEVTVFGAWFDPALKKRDQKLLGGASFRFVPVVDWTAEGFAGWSARLECRVRAKSGQLAFRLFGRETLAQLGYAAPALRRAALGFPADLYIAHSEAGLAAASALRRQNRIGVDMEDWFSEDMLPEARNMRPLREMRRMERVLLGRAAHSTCPSKAMSVALAEEYGCRPPVVVYNAFPWADRARIDGTHVDRRDPNTPSIHWVSQTLGPGRGLEDLLAALPLLAQPVEVHLRGRAAPGFEKWLGGTLAAQWRDRIFLHDLVPNDELLPRIAEHDVGFSGEQQFCRSRDLTVTNKILHYLCGGLAVVATDTAGHREVAAAAPGAVFLYPIGDSRALAARLDRLLGDSQLLAAAKHAAELAAERVFCWEGQVATLVTSANDACANAYDS
jgi:glycosyltransferase involved in cell wall biosynthesis